MFHLSAESKRKKLHIQASHLILSGIYESKERLEHTLQSMTKQKNSFLTYHHHYTHLSHYLFAINWPSARLHKGFIYHRHLFHTSHYFWSEAASATRDFFLLPFLSGTLQRFSSPVATTAKPLLAITHLSFGSYTRHWVAVDLMHYLSFYELI